LKGIPLGIEVFPELRTCGLAPYFGYTFTAISK